MRAGENEGNMIGMGKNEHTHLCRVVVSPRGREADELAMWNSIDRWPCKNLSLDET